MCSVILDYDFTVIGNLAQVPCQPGVRPYLPKQFCLYFFQLLTYINYLGPFFLLKSVGKNCGRNILLREIFCFPQNSAIKKKLPCHLSVPPGILFFSNSHFTQCAALSEFWFMEASLLWLPSNTAPLSGLCSPFKHLNQSQLVAETHFLFSIFTLPTPYYWSINLRMYALAFNLSVLLLFLVLYFYLIYPDLLYICAERILKLSYSTKLL